MSKYAIVQYLPDPSISERINIGVVVYGDGRVLTQFLRDWSRVRHFGQEDITFLHDFVKDVSEQMQNDLSIPGLPQVWRLDEQTLQKMVGCWHNSIQISEPRGSTLPPEELLAFISPRFLRVPVRETRTLRDKRYAVNLVEQPLGIALKQRLGEKGPSLIKKYKTIAGKEDTHHVDLSVSNGQIYCACEGISFEIVDRKYLGDRLKLTAYAIGDIKQAATALPFGVIIIPPNRETSRSRKTHEDDMEVFRDTRSRFHRLGADIITEQTADEWAFEAVEKTVPKTLLLE